MSTNPIIIQTSVDLSGIEGYNAGVASLVSANQQAVGSLDQVNKATGDLDKEIQYLNTSNLRQKAQFDDTAAGADHMGYSIREARGGARLLADEMGINLNRELSGVLARSELIGPALESAFSVLAIVGFIDLLEQVGKAINDDVEALAGWGEEQKKQYQAELSLNSDILSKSIQRKSEERDLNAIGLQGAAEKKKLTEDAVASQKDYAAATAVAQGEISGLQGKLDHLQGLQKIPIIFDQDKLKEEIKEVTDSLERVQKTRDEFAAKQTDLGFQVKKLGTQGASDVAKDAREKGQAQIDADHETALSRIAVQEEYARTEYQTQHTSLQAEVAAIQSSDQQKLAADQSYTAQRVALLNSEFKAGVIADPAKDIIALNERVSEEKQTLSEKDKALVLTSNAEIRKSDEDISRAQIDSFYLVDEAQKKLIEDRDKVTFDEAKNPATVMKAAATYAGDLNQKYEEQAAKLKEIAVLEESNLLIKESGQQFDLSPKADFGTSQFAKELDAARKYNPQIVAELLRLNAEEMEIRANGAAAAQALASEEYRRLNELAARSTEEEIAQSKNAQEQILRDDKAAFDQREAIAKAQNVGLNAGPGLDAAKMEQSKQELAEYQQELAQFTREFEQDMARIAALKNILAGGGILTPEQLAELRAGEQEMRQLGTQMDQVRLKIIQLRAESQTTFQQFDLALKNAANSGVQSFNQGFLKMAAGQQNFVQTMEGVWNSMAESFITSILKIGEQWISTSITNLAATETSETAAAASTVASQSTSQFARAKSAAAGAYSAMADIPIVGPELGAIAAAAVFAAAMAFAKGGIVPGSGYGDSVPAMLSPGEMVLPEHISSFVQDRAALGVTGGAGGRGGDGGSSSNTIHQRNNFEIHQHGGKMSVDEIAAAMKQATRRGMVQ